MIVLSFLNGALDCLRECLSLFCLCKVNLFSIIKRYKQSRHFVPLSLVSAPELVPVKLVLRGAVHSCSQESWGGVVSSFYRLV